MKKIIILIAPVVIGITVSAQSVGDYRSIGNGSWNDATKWETYNGSSWVTASTYPGQNPGTGLVTITNETQIMITSTVPNPISSLFVSAEYARGRDNYSSVPLGKLIFSAESVASLTVTTSVGIYGELLIDNQNGSKNHSIFIGGGLLLGDGYGTMGDYGYEEFYTRTIFQTINQDDKLNVTFNTTVPNSSIGGSEFDGVSFQPLTFNGDVTFNGIGISGGGKVNGHANFINGKVSGGITFGDGATYSGVSAASYVEGSVTKEGNDAFTFPIGSSGIYAPLTISPPVGQTETFMASYRRGDAEGLGIITDPGLLSVSNCEYWILEPGSSNSNNYSLDVTVGWTTASGCGTAPYINNLSDVTLARFNHANNSWDNHGGSGIGTTTNGYVTSTGVNAFGYFTLGNLGSCAVPFELNTTNIALTSATLNWSALASSVSCDVEYKPVSSSTWINAASATTSRSVNLTGLSPLTGYYWRVRSNCTSSSSTYKYSSFTTPIACGDPAGLSASNITSNSATLSWGAATNALYYSVEYKTYYESTWTTAATQLPSLSYTLGGLTGNMAYDWRVRAICNAPYQGNYVHSPYFITLEGPCIDVYETNNTSSQAKSINPGNSVPAIISSTNDIDWFKVTTHISYTNLEVTLMGLPADYDLYVYNKSIKLIGSSTNSGTSNEVVIYNSSARNATYYIKVIGKNGAYNPGCYYLQANVFPTGGRTASRASDPVNEISGDENNQLLYPNPASEFVYLGFNSTMEGPVNIQLFNTSGQLAKQVAVKITKGYNQVKIAINDVKEGMYLLRIDKGELNIVRKFLISR